jgi:tetratricopeptide (TPR) repeat protein
MIKEPAFSWFVPEVEALGGIHELHRGNMPEAQGHLERALAGFAARPLEQRVSPAWPLPNDPISGSAAGLAAVSAVRGELDAAERWQQESLRRAEEIGYPLGPSSVAFAKASYGAWIKRFLGDDEAAARLGIDAVAIGQEHGYAFWTAYGAVWAATETPGGPPDREFLERTLAVLLLLGHRAFRASHLAFLARLDEQAGDLDRADEHLEEAFAAAQQSGEDLHLPELLRQRARTTLTRTRDADRVLADLTEAVHIATRQGARVSRLRAAVDIAHLPADHRPEDWWTLLAEARADLPPSARIPELTEVDGLLAV